MVPSWATKVPSWATKVPATSSASACGSVAAARPSVATAASIKSACEPSPDCYTCPLFAGSAPVECMG